jgi:hypothetical protein
VGDANTSCPPRFLSCFKISSARHGFVPKISSQIYATGCDVLPLQRLCCKMHKFIDAVLPLQTTPIATSVVEYNKLCCLSTKLLGQWSTLFFRVFPKVIKPLVVRFFHPMRLGSFACAAVGHSRVIRCSYCTRPPVGGSVCRSSPCMCVCCTDVDGRLKL